MDRRFEEEMLEAAFGDMTPEEAEAIAREAANDPETAKVFAEYRDMREGLKSLREVPPHQLSTDRLRHAILQQGLKPKRIGWNLGWLFAPAAAAAVLLMGYVLMNPSQSQSPRLAVEKGDEKPFVTGVREDFASDASVYSEAFGPSIPREWTGVAVDNDRPVATDERPVRRIVRERPKSGGAARVQPASGETLAVMSDEDYGPPAPMPAAPGVMAADYAGNGSGIVVIESERGEMGANRATEVDSARNVVIGG